MRPTVAIRCRMDHVIFNGERLNNRDKNTILHQKKRSPLRLNC